MKKKYVLVLLMMLAIGTIALAQQGYNFPGYQCQQLLYRDSSRQLINLTNKVESVLLFFPSGNDGLILNISFTDGSLPLMYFFMDAQRLSDGSTFFNNVSQEDPETMRTIAEGFAGGYKREGSKAVIIINRGTVTYLNLTLIE